MSEPTIYTQSGPEPATAKPSRGKRVLVGAALVAAGLVAGGGAPYAVASQFNPASPEGTSTVHPGGRGGPRGGGVGRQPAGAPPRSVLPAPAAPRTAPAGTT